MNDRNLRLLLIEDNLADVRLIRESIRETGKPVDLEAATGLAEGIDRLSEGFIDLVLLDLSLPESFGLDTFIEIHRRFPAVPVVILTALEAETLALEAIHQGAQDYLIKGKTDPEMLMRSVLFAIERQEKLKDARERLFLDEVTGLLNRRGFERSGGKVLRTADRLGLRVFLVFAWISNYPEESTYVGPVSIPLCFKKILTHSFRDNDTLARIGPAEFSVLCMESSQYSGPRFLTERLKENLDEFNEERKNKCEIELEVGTSVFKPGGDFDPGPLIERARQMCLKKLSSKEAERLNSH